MEDADFCNNRISNYLNGTILDEVEVYQNFQADENLHQIVQNAFAEAKARASETYLAIKIDWMGDIEKYEQRAEAYFQYRERTLNNVLVDNIRESRRKKNQEQRSLELAALERKKMIVPKIELVQTAYVEFI